MLQIFLAELSQCVSNAVCLSERHNHARELARDADLSQWDAFVIVSGDGLLFEVHGDTCTQQERGNTHFTQQEFQLKRFTQLVPKWIEVALKTLLVGKSGNIAPPILLVEKGH